MVKLSNLTNVILTTNVKNKNNVLVLVSHVWHSISVSNTINVPQVSKKSSLNSINSL